MMKTTKLPSEFVIAEVNMNIDFMSNVKIGKTGGGGPDI
jgi:hypothetical protein